MSPAQVTLLVLPASLSLVHIPRSRVPHLSHYILRQILQPNPTFLNITCNEVELSIFAEYHMLDDFEPVARRDRRRQRSRSGSNTSRKNSTSESTQPIEISYDRWSVVQIDSHSDQLDNSGARVHELSAPLAAAGISILYQSSYMSDFIFVRQSRLEEVMYRLSMAGFDLFAMESPAISRCISPVESTTQRPTETTIFASRSNSTEKMPTKEGTPTRQKSHSPTAGEVRLLSTQLTCVGLSDDNIDNWALKIIKLVAFPELISKTPARRPTSMHIPEPNSSNHTPVMDSFIYADFTRGRQSTPSTNYDLEETSSESSADEDAYFSHSPSASCSSFSALSRSQSDAELKPAPVIASAGYRRASSKHILAPLSPITVNTTPALHNQFSPMISTSPTSANSFTIPSCPIEKSATTSPLTVPFFSFTRTPEGSSLTTDALILATLFPAGNERHMVICSGQLEAADKQLAEQARSPRSRDSSPHDEDSDDEGEGFMQCLQIDLKRFGLDKYGLINRFSQVLQENGINHMYSSTFKTANILVEKRYAHEAQVLLRSC